MRANDELRKAIDDLYDVVGRLEAMYPGRHFTPDGHMVGSLGEVVAADRYGLELFEASYPMHDAKASDGRLVQIKTTQGTRVALSDCPEYLIVMRLTRDGSFEEVYNGPGKQVWDATGRLQKTGQRHISISKLMVLSGNVEAEDRI